MELVQSELHGPFLCVIRVDSHSEYIESANGLPHGTGAVVFAEDQEVFEAVAAGLQAGFVSRNRRVVEADMPREGWKASGKGRLLGLEAFREQVSVQGVGW